ncbi:MAG: DUF3764 family protein [Pseudomonadota bacterium]|nr:DUF3764 family protein [Pseudomonadota bacterium]
MAILVKTEITITNGFEAWKKMVHAQTDKLHEMGISFLYAATEHDDPTKLHTAMRFDSLEVLKQFGADETLINERREAGVIIESGILTILSEDFMTNYPEPFIQR